jgi:hypothetical protein
MPIDVHPARMRGRSPEQITAEQKEQAARDKARADARKAAVTNVPVKTSSASTAVAAPDTRTKRRAQRGDAHRARCDAGCGCR